MALSKTVKSKPAAAGKKPATKAAPQRKKVAPIPKGYRNLTPYLMVNNGKDAIAFYKKAFGAKEMMRMEHTGGIIAHAELQIGDSKIMLADVSSEKIAKGPKELGGTSVGIHFYTDNVDAIVKKAVKAGAILERPIEDMFYGDRSGSLEDPFGHKWYISTRVEIVSPAEVKKRAKQLFGQKK